MNSTQIGNHSLASNRPTTWFDFIYAADVSQSRVTAASWTNSLQTLGHLIRYQIKLDFELSAFILFLFMADGGCIRVTIKRSWGKKWRLAAKLETKKSCNELVERFSCFSRTELELAISSVLHPVSWYKTKPDWWLVAELILILVGYASCHPLKIKSRSIPQDSRLKYDPVICRGEDWLFCFRDACTTLLQLWAKAFYISTSWMWLKDLTVFFTTVTAFPSCPLAKANKTLCRKLPGCFLLPMCSLLLIHLHLPPPEWSYFITMLCSRLLPL